MSFAVFLQIFANVVFTAALFVVFARLRRPAKDDPRLSKGLQLLSSKIAVLEDLSDRTETQVQQMLLLLDQKSRELQSKIGLAEQQVGLVRQSMQQSLEVAQIFQDKIPHTEIIERQNSVKYIRAARLAHAGMSVADIALEVDLPIGEIEFISKVNQESLSFREEDLPAWAREPEQKAVTAPRNLSANVAHQNMAASMEPVINEQMPVAPTADENLVGQLNKLQFEMKNLDLELQHRANRNVLPETTQAFSQPRVESTSLERLGQEFRRAVEQAEKAEQDGHTGSFAESFAQAFAGNFAPNELPALAEQLAAKPAPAAPMTAGTSAEPTRFTPPPAVAAHTPAHFAMNVPSAKPATSVQATAPAATAPATGTIARNVSIPELEAARAAAAALRITESPAATKTTSNKEIKSVRRVEFPRI